METINNNLSIELVSYFLSFGTVGVIIGIVLGFFVKIYLNSYMKEKGRNLATQEDIGKITDKIESVKSEHSEKLQKLLHQNNLLIEKEKNQNKMRLAALEKRLEAHQEAYTLWREMLRNTHSENTNQEVALLCQSWWEKNCIYLDSRSRKAFQEAYMAMRNHEALKMLSEKERIKQNWDIIIAAGEAIVEGADLPSIGSGEIKLIDKKR